MNYLVILILFFLLTSLNFVEALSTVARRVGFLVEDPVSGYSVQSFISIAIRFLNLLFMPLMGVCLDTATFRSLGAFVCLLSFLVPVSLFFLYANLDSLTPVLKKLLKKMKDTGGFTFLIDAHLLPVCVSLIISAAASFWVCIRRFSLPSLFDDLTKLILSEVRMFKVFRGAILPFALFYICWPLIAVSSIFLPSQSALLLSMSPFLNGWSTLYSSVSIDPALLVLQEDYILSAYAYKQLTLVKTLSSFISSVSLLLIFVLFSCLSR